MMIWLAGEVLVVITEVVAVCAIRAMGVKRQELAEGEAEEREE